MPHTLLPGNTRCFPLELPSTNLDEYGFFSYYDPNTKPCSFQQDLYKKKYFLDKRIGAATVIFRSSIVVHGGLVLDIIDELMLEYNKCTDMKNTISNDKEQKRKYVFTSANIHNAWLKKVLEKIDDEEHTQISDDDVHFQTHTHAISDSLSNQFFQLDLLSRRWQHIPTFLEDYGPLLKPRMCQTILGDGECFFMYGGLIPMNKSEITSQNIDTHLSNTSTHSSSSSTSHINEEQLLLATNELWRLDVVSKVFVCINDQLDNSSIPKRYNHHSLLATFIERFEVPSKKDDIGSASEDIPTTSPHGKKIKVGDKLYIEKPVKKLIILGGLGSDDEEIFKVDVFNLETNNWESGAEGPYRDFYLDFSINKEFETSVIIDNPLTGYSSIVVYKKNELSPLRVVPLLYKNTYNLNNDIVSEIYDPNLDEYSKEGLTENFVINTSAFDQRLNFLNRNLLNPQMRIFGPNLLVSGFCNRNNKSVALVDLNGSKLSKDKNSDEHIDASLIEPELLYKTYCFSLMNGKWIEINTRCIDGLKCSHHLISESYVWSSHHKLLFMGCCDYRKLTKDSSHMIHRISPFLQKFDHIISTGLTLTSLFHKNSIHRNQDISFAKAQQLFFSSQDHNYTLLKYINSSPADELAGITNLDVKRFKDFAEYSAPLSTLTANKSIMPPYSMLLGKTMFVDCGEDVADFEIIPANGRPVLCSMTVLRKRWGRYFDSILAHAYIESINTFEALNNGGDGSKFSSVSSAAKGRKHSSIPSIAKDKTKHGFSQSSLKNSITANLFNDVQLLNNASSIPLEGSPNLNLELTKPSNDTSDIDTSTRFQHDSVDPLTETKNLKVKDGIFKNTFFFKSQDFDQNKHAEPDNEEIAGSPLSRADGNSPSRHGSLSSCTTQETASSKPQTLTSSTNGMVFRVPFQNNADFNLNENIVVKTNSNRYHPYSESISSQVKRLSESRRKSITPSHNVGESQQRSRTHSLSSANSKKICSILPDIDLNLLPPIQLKPATSPIPPVKNTNESKPLPEQTKEHLTTTPYTGTGNFSSRRKSSAAADLMSQKEFLRNSPLPQTDSYGRRGSALSNCSDNDKPFSFSGKQSFNSNQDTNSISMNKGSFSTIHDMPSKPGSISSSIRSQSADTVDSVDSVINSELEPLMIPRTLYLPWSHASVTAFTEFFYTGQINPKWQLQPVALDIFVMSKLYEVPLLYDIMTEVFYSIIGRKEEYVFKIKEQIAEKYMSISRKYLVAIGSDEPLEEYVGKSKSFSIFRKLEISLQNIDDGYCDYFLLKQASKAVDLDDEELIEASLFSNFNPSLPKNSLAEDSSSKLQGPNYPGTPSKNSEFGYYTGTSPAQYQRSDYSGVSPKTSFSRNTSSGLDLKITAMKKNSFQKYQMSQSDSLQTAPDISSYVDSIDLLRDENHSPKSKSFPIRPALSFSSQREPNSSSLSNHTFNQDFVVTDFKDLINSDEQVSTSSSSGSDPEDNETTYGSSSAKSEQSGNVKLSKDAYGFGLLSPVKVAKKVEEHYLEEPNEFADFWLGHNENANSSQYLKTLKSGNKDDTENFKLSPKEAAKKMSKNSYSLTLEQLASSISRHPVEFVIQLIYEVATQSYDLMLSMRARNCLEMCKMYKSVARDMKHEIQVMEEKMSEIRQHRQEVQKAQYAQHMHPTVSNMKPSQSYGNANFVNANTPNTDVKKASSLSNENKLNIRPTMKKTLSSASSTGKNLLSSLGMTSMSNMSSSVVGDDNEIERRSVNSSVSSSMSKSTSSKKKSVLDSVKQMKPKRSMSILNLFKRNSSDKDLV